MLTIMQSVEITAEHVSTIARKLLLDASEREIQALVKLREKYAVPVVELLDWLEDDKPAGKRLCDQFLEAFRLPVAESLEQKALALMVPVGTWKYAPTAYPKCVWCRGAGCLGCFGEAMREVRRNDQANQS